MPSFARAMSPFLFAVVALLAAAPPAGADTLTDRVQGMTPPTADVPPVDLSPVGGVDVPPVGGVDAPPVDPPPVGPVEAPRVDPPPVGRVDAARAEAPRAVAPAPAPAAASPRPGATPPAVNRSPRRAAGRSPAVRRGRAVQRSEAVRRTAPARGPDRSSGARPVPDPAPAPPRSTATPPAAAEALIDDVLGTVRPAAANAGFPLLLLLAGAAFLLAQHRIDRRDPKLAGSPLTADPGLPFGPPPEA